MKRAFSLVAGDVETAMAMGAAARHTFVAEVAARALRQDSNDTFLDLAPSLFGESLRVAHAIVRERSARPGSPVIDVMSSVVDSEHRMTALRHLAEHITDDFVSVGVMLRGSLSDLLDTVHVLLIALVVLLAASRASCRMQVAVSADVTRLRLRPLSIAPGAPPAPLCLHLPEGLAAVA